MDKENKIESWEWLMIAVLFAGMFLAATCTLTYNSHLRITIDEGPETDTIIKANSIKISIDTLKIDKDDQ